MKLYIWDGDGVLESHGTGIIGAMATSLNEAMFEVVKKVNKDFKGKFSDDWKDLLEGDEFFSIILHKAPKVYDTPKAFYLWGND